MRACFAFATWGVDNRDVLRTTDLEYDLPASAVATRPAQPRDSARMLVVSRTDERRIEHARVGDLARFVRRGDALVMNDTRVLPARIEGVKAASPETGSVVGAPAQGGGRVTGLFLGESEGATGREWRVMLKSNGRLREGLRVRLRGSADRVDGPTLHLLRKEGDAWAAALEGAGPGEPLSELLGRIGATPMPPYILGARRDGGVEVADEEDREWYQTVYAREGAGSARSVAAPTAGLHFTPGLLGELEAAGVTRETVTLHVGAGTFKPVEAEFVERHEMHEEWFEVGAHALSRLAERRAAGGRVIAVGTTSVRALESVPHGSASAGTITGSTRLLITPGYRFGRVDGLLTNFHLPRSTLLALVGAFLETTERAAGLGAGSPGVARLLSLYRLAIGMGYRFYSYGDAMLILP